MDNSSSDSASTQFVSAPIDSPLLGEDNFRHLAEALPEIVFTTTPQGEVDYFSDRWGKFGGISEDDPEYLNWTVRIHPDDLDELRRTWRAAVHAGEIYEHEFRMRSADGEYFWFSTKVIPVRDSNHTVVKWYGVTTDINDQKKMELELRAISERKDEFLAMLGHELRNPLAALNTSYEVLTRPGASGKKNEKAFQLLGDQIRHLTRLVDDTLDISRLTSGKLRLIKCPVEINQLVLDCCENYQDQVAQKELTLSAISLESEVWVDGDDVRITQCLTNLLNNSVKFTDPGGSIVIKLEVEGSMVNIEVRDTGVGMTQPEMDRIFEPFEQGKGAQRLSTAGLGLGLAVIEKLVGLHGGTITGTSPGKGQGAAFTVSLPIGEAPHPVEDEEPSPVELESLGILILEDNESVALSLQMFFELEGHQVRVASSGDRALAMLEEETPDILISDLTLPGHLSGWDVAEKITGSYPEQRLPYLVALSGHTQPHHQQKSLEVGFDHHLAKPPTPGQLRSVLVDGMAELARRRTR